MCYITYIIYNILYTHIANVSSSACVQPRKWLAGCQYGWQQVWGRVHLRQREGMMESLCYTYHNTNVYMPWRHRNGATVAIVHLCVYKLLTSLICTHRISTPSLDFRHATGQATGKRKGGLERRRGGQRGNASVNTSTSGQTGASHHV